MSVRVTFTDGADGSEDLISEDTALVPNPHFLTDQTFSNVPTCAADEGRHEGIWTDGVAMWVVDGGESVICAYKVSDQTRDTTKNFNLVGLYPNIATHVTSDRVHDVDSRLPIFRQPQRDCGSLQPGGRSSRPFRDVGRVRGPRAGPRLRPAGHRRRVGRRQGDRRGRAPGRDVGHGGRNGVGKDLRVQPLPGRVPRRPAPKGHQLVPPRSSALPGHPRRVAVAPGLQRQPAPASRTRTSTWARFTPWRQAAPSRGCTSRAT